RGCAHRYRRVRLQRLPHLPGAVHHQGDLPVVRGQRDAHDRAGGAHDDEAAPRRAEAVRNFRARGRFEGLMLRALLRLVAAVAALAGNGTARAADWPTYHGDNARTGVASSPAVGQLSRAWSARLDGKIYASPQIAGVRGVAD